MYVGALAFGLTSCDPSNLQASELPDDSDLLIDRPEYWVVSKDVANCPQRGDELSFCVTPTGKLLTRLPSLALFNRSNWRCGSYRAIVWQMVSPSEMYILHLVKLLCFTTFETRANFFQIVPTSNGT